MIQEANLAPLFIVVPFAASFLTAILGRWWRRSGDFFAVLATFSTLIFAVLAVQAVHVHGTMVYSVGAWKPPIGVAMVLDGLSVFVLLAVNFVVFAISVFALKYMERYTAKWKFWVLFLLMLGGMNGVVVTGDIFNLYVFLEVASLASYVLIAFGTRKHELEAAFKYAIMSTVGSLFILFSIVLLYSYTSTLNMADMANVLASKGGGNVGLMIMALLIMGFGLKAALVPFHAWLPDAHPSAPAPISAMLSGVVIKSLGVYALVRIFFNVTGFSPTVSSILMVLAVISMLAGGFLAIGQSDFKRLLAYSSISQIGTMIFSFSLGTPLGILGGLFHLFNHSVMKSLLFLNSGSIEYATGTRDLDKLGGLMKKMPVTGATSFIAAMSISGIPPFAGFWSKLVIVFAAIAAGKFAYAFLVVLASVLTLVALSKALRAIFFGVLKEGLSQVKEVPLSMKFATILLSIVCLAGGALLLPGVRELFLDQASAVLFGGIQYGTIVLSGIS